VVVEQEKVNDGKRVMVLVSVADDGVRLSDATDIEGVSECEGD
jgi:hypothetical protein